MGGNLQKAAKWLNYKERWKELNVCNLADNQGTIWELSTTLQSIDIKKEELGIFIYNESVNIWNNNEIK